MTPNQYRIALRKIGLSQRGAGRLFGAGERTSRRWAENDANIPDCVGIVLRLLVAGKITTKDVEDARK